MQVHPRLQLAYARAALPPLIGGQQMGRGYVEKG